ncbi:MAG: apolipoprotein N-acyltransferase [Alphaproteobacteria bacterium]|nr:apolipoprotein N-acyltransferase [Alphaproteobacteria bacterium]
MTLTSCTTEKFARFRNALESMTGFRRYATAFLLGSVMTAILAPIGFFPVLLVCVPGLAFLARTAPTRWKSFLVGWVFGAGYFIFGLYWVSAALFVDIKQWGWVLPLSVIVGPAILALYYGFVTLFAHRYRARPVAHGLALVASWSGVEWLRGHLFTGFPWNLPGYAWHWDLPVIQTAAVTGIYGLTLITLFWAMAPVFVPRRRLLAGFAVFSFIALTAAGGLRLALNPTEQAGDATVRIVQANIPETVKWDQDQDWRNLEKHIKLSKKKSSVLSAPPTVIVWPETAISADLQQFPDIAHIIAINMQKGSTAILGELRVDAAMASRPSFYNSVAVMDSNGAVLHTYDKHHLVPFGEYIPFRDKVTFKPLALAMTGISDFTPGDGPHTIKVDGLPSFSPLICYEVIFPGAVASRAHRPGWLVNVTNDAWYGKTEGPHQHLAIARMRAVEEGLPLARAANTGISAMFDGAGRELGSQRLATAGIVDAILPKALPPTTYTQFGDSIFFLLLILTAGAAEVLYRKESST